MSITDIAPISSTADVIDSRDIIARIEQLEEALNDEDLTPEDLEEMEEDAEELSDLKEFVKYYADGIEDWEHGATLINEDYFTEAMKEQTQDIGDLPAELPSYVVIDWDATADNLKMDYQTVTFRGTEFYVR